MTDILDTVKAAHDGKIRWTEHRATGWIEHAYEMSLDELREEWKEPCLVRSLIAELDALVARCEQAEAENARLRERINDDRLYLSSCVANLADMAGTPWHDGLKRLAALEADYDR